jgi:hypothetical protein
VADARAQQRVALVLFDVHEVTGEKNAREPPAEVEVLDAREDGLGPAHVRQHLGGLVHRDHGMAQPDELVGDATDAAPELEDSSTRRDRGVDELGLAARRQMKVRLHRTAVRRNCH